jgi:hypothetical protein
MVAENSTTIMPPPIRARTLDQSAEDNAPEHSPWQVVRERGDGAEQNDNRGFDEVNRANVPS